VSANPFGTDTKACEFANLTMIRIGSLVLFRVLMNSVIRVVLVSSVFWCENKPIVNTWNLEIETKTFPRCTLLISDSQG
jgi:hypothetical protein